MRQDMAITGTQLCFAQHTHLLDMLPLSAVERDKLPRLKALPRLGSEEERRLACDVCVCCTCVQLGTMRAWLYTSSPSASQPTAQPTQRACMKRWSSNEACGGVGRSSGEAWGSTCCGRGTSCGCGYSAGIEKLCEGGRSVSSGSVVFSSGEEGGGLSTCSGLGSLWTAGCTGSGCVLGGACAAMSAGAACFPCGACGACKACCQLGLSVWAPSQSPEQLNDACEKV